jgi:hypothetical protein
MALVRHKAATSRDALFCGSDEVLQLQRGHGMTTSVFQASNVCGLSRGAADVLLDV